MNDEEQAKAYAVILALVIVAALIWSSWGKGYEAHTEIVTMPDGSTRECDFIGYGRTMTTLECRE